MVREKLAAANGLATDAIEIVVIKTSGDLIQDRNLSEVGGKGLFTKEIEEALIDKRIDLAVHSMKDVATRLPDGLVISTILEREDPRDAFLSLSSGGIAALPRGAVVGTSSLRRQAQVLARRPDLKIVPFRGNVETRLAKLQRGEAVATFLAMAGLKRLGMAEHVTAAIAQEEMLPAVAQGAVGVEIRVEDTKTAAMLAPLDHVATHLAVTAERAFLARLDGSCRTPIAGHAVLDGAGGLSFAGEILTPNGQERHATRREGRAVDAARLGDDAGQELLGRAGPAFFSGQA
jgi:hydroxymethylbilane synthase